MADRPACTGATNATVALAFPGLAELIVGAQDSLPNSMHPASPIKTSAVSPPKWRIAGIAYCTKN